MSSPSDAPSTPAPSTSAPSAGPYQLYPLLAAEFPEVFERPGAAGEGGSPVPAGADGAGRQAGRD
jgi:hypothetical protein